MAAAAGAGAGGARARAVLRSRGLRLPRRLRGFAGSGPASGCRSEFFPAKEAVRSFRARPGRGGVSEGSRTAREGPGFACARGERRGDGGRPSARSGSGIPGPLDCGTLATEGAILSTPLATPAFPFVRGWRNGRLESGKFSHTARQCLLCDTMFLRVMLNSVVQGFWFFRVFFFFLRDWSRQC